MCLEKLIFQLFVCQPSPTAAVKPQGDDTVRLSVVLSTVKGSTPRSVISEKQKLIKATGIFSVPHTWLNPVMPVVTCKQVNCTFIAHLSTGCTSLRHKTCRGRLLKHVFNSQEFCDTGMDLSTALSRFHPTAEKVRGPRTLLQGSKLKVQS